MLIDINNWDNFISNFTGGKSYRKNPTSVTISRSAGAAKKLSTASAPNYASKFTLTRYNYSSHKYEDVSDEELHGYFQQMLNKSSTTEATNAPSH